jgi:hypothetical protein
MRNCEVSEINKASRLSNRLECFQKINCVADFEVRSFEDVYGRVKFNKFLDCWSWERWRPRLLGTFQRQLDAQLLL